MGVTRALLENRTQIRLDLIPKAIFGLLALLCGNAYIVGINQIYDEKIDEVRLYLCLSISRHLALLQCVSSRYPTSLRRSTSPSCPSLRRSSPQATRGRSWSPASPQVPLLTLHPI
jgi:hypothetical protein